MNTIKESIKNNIEALVKDNESFSDIISEKVYNIYRADNSVERVNLSNLLGKTIISIFQCDEEAIVILTDDGYAYVLVHEQECCESVYIEDICGDLEDTIGLVTRAEENSSDRIFDEHDDCCQRWTYYKLDTIKDNVTIRFLGSSNGYYSDSVSVLKCFIPELIELKD